MSDNTRLGISITASDTATASIRQLENTIRSLRQTLADLGGSAADQGGKITNALNIEIAKIQQEITARTGQTTAIKATTAAIQEQTAAAVVLHRTLQQGIDASFGVGADRQIKSAAESARVLATSLNTAAEADARLRNEVIVTAAALERQKLAGSGLTLTPAGSFGKRLDSQIFNIQPQLDARAHAMIQRQLEATFAQTTPAMRAAGVGLGSAVTSGIAQGIEGKAEGAAVGAAVAGLLQRESRHIVGLFDSLARGQRGQAISSIGAAARDAGLGVGALSASMGALIAVVGTVALVHAAENMGRWASQTRAAASAAGMSLKDYSTLQGALGLIGEKAESADATLRHFAVSLSTATAEPASLAAQAFHNLGISQQELVNTGGNVGVALKILADAFVRNADGANKSANMNEILGHGFERLIPALQHGGQGMADLQDKATFLGHTLSEETAAVLEKTGENATSLGMAISGNAIKAMESWAPVINKTIDLLRTLVNVLGVVIGLAGKLASLPIQAAEFAGKALPGGRGPQSEDELMRMAYRAQGLPIPPALAARLAIQPPPIKVGGATSAGLEGGSDAASAAAAAAKAQPGALIHGHGGEATVLDAMRLQMAQASEIASQGAKNTTEARMAEARAEIDVMQKTLSESKLTAKQKEQIETELARKRTQLQHETLSEAQSAEATVLENMRLRMTQAGEMASRSAKTSQQARQAETKAEIEVIKQTLANETLTNKQREQIGAELASKQMALRNETLSAGASAAKQSYSDFAAGERLKISEADGSSKKILAIYDEWIAAANSKYGQHVNVIVDLERKKVQEVNAARLTEIKEGARAEEQQNKLNILNSQLGEMAKGTFPYAGQKVSADTERAQSKRYLEEAAQVKAAADVEIAALTKVRDAAEQGSATQKAASQEIMNVLIQSKSQEVELYKKAGDAAASAANKAMEGFNKFFDSVGSEFETFTHSVVKSLISPQTEMVRAGLTTIKTSLKGSELQSAFSTMVTGMVGKLGSAIEEAIGSTIAKALSGGAADTIGQLLSQTFGKMLSNITGGALGSVLGTAAGGAAGSAAVVGAITATSTASTTAIGGAIAAEGAALISAISASTIAIVGAVAAGSAAEDALLAALNIKPSILGFSYASGGIVPSAAGGMVLGGNGGTLAILHAREMVLPAELSTGIQQMIRRSGGGNSNNASLNYSPTINTGTRSRSGTGMSRSEFSAMLSMHSGSLLGEAQGMMRQGWRPP